ncbi:hypothetical protein GPL21_06920 [Bradyrhizobium pachyrhizi]|uniref:Kazal-like domain-containing protein n=1 Tax=Bradyrhizobium pachyrhizi TaxID=280333 RepID=A0A844SGF9_9BRAD|nr:hypothetical protein [Bradyrhizobium pachyrhizi]MVT64837.1 hypothetical protein [Bradyrhizobium pachyrhizi]
MSTTCPNRFLVAFATIFLLGPMLCSEAHAQQTFEEMRSLMQAGICRSDYQTVDPPTYQSCESPCESYKGSLNWNSCMNACSASQAKDANTAREWNAHVARCRAATQKPAAAPAPPSPRTARPAGSGTDTPPSSVERAKLPSNIDDRLRAAKEKNVKKEKEEAGFRARLENEKAEDAAKEARERAQQLEEERIARELQEAQKWRCFGENGNVTQGFHQCRAECGSFYPSQYCQAQCYASSSGSIASGRSCFKMP